MTKVKSIRVGVGVIINKLTCKITMHLISVLLVLDS